MDAENVRDALGDRARDCQKSKGSAAVATGWIALGGASSAVADYRLGVRALPYRLGGHAALN
jgi:hypothetical protein